MSGWHFAAIGIGIVVALSGLYVWAANKAIDALCWEDEGE